MKMEDIIDTETDLTKKLNGLQKRLEKVAHPDLGSRDLGKVHELIKANLQRKWTQKKESVEIFRFQ